MRQLRHPFCRRLPVIAVLLSAALLTAAPAAAQNAAGGADKKAIADKIAKTYGVTVLRTRDAEVDGKPVLYVTVMNGGGNSNGAFQVTTLEVDPATGELISQYRTTPTGQVDGAPGPTEPSTEESGEVMRQLSTRDSRR
jgi:hypothetical protein